ncbi:MAG TPA: hypothetical protein VKB57_17410 [Acidimicrobiales bacterium]|nr:hypothetical protein [Acidimicrobiales bacterium]
MTTATDHEDAIRAALARRAATLDPPVPPLTALPAEPRLPMALPRRRVWLAAAAALVLVAGAVAVLAARDDAGRGPDTRTGPATTLPEPPADAVWPLADDVPPASLAGPVRAARAYLAAMRVGPQPVPVRLTDPPSHGRATVAYGTRPGGTVSLRRVDRVWFVTASASPAITVSPAMSSDPLHVEVGIRLRPGVWAGGVVTVVDDAGTIVDLVTVTPPPSGGVSTAILVAPSITPGRPGEPPVRDPLQQRSSVLPCICMLHPPEGTTARAVVVNVLALGGGGSVAAVPVRPR